MASQDHKRYDCVGIGLATYDFTLEVRQYPEVNTKHTATRWAERGGGPVPTAIRTLAALGGRTALVTTMGDDFMGRTILEDIRSFGVEPSGIRLDAAADTLHSHILVEQGTGRRTVVQHTGQLPEIRPSQVPETLLRDTRTVTLDSRPTPEIIELVRQARDQGARIMLDAGSVHQSTEALLPLVDYPVVSAAFAEEYFGQTDYEQACRSLIAGGATLAGVTLGAEGSVLGREGKTVHVPAFQVDAADTTGAGDMYHGALLFGLLQGWALRPLGQFASAVAAMGIREFGSGTGLPGLHDVTMFLREHGIWEHPAIRNQQDPESDEDSIE